MYKVLDAKYNSEIGFFYEKKDAQRARLNYIKESMAIGSVSPDWESIKDEYKKQIRKAVKIYQLTA